VPATATKVREEEGGVAGLSLDLDRAPPLAAVSTWDGDGSCSCGAVPSWLRRPRRDRERRRALEMKTVGNGRKNTQIISVFIFV
jgi:hypothetical protein